MTRLQEFLLAEHRYELARYTCLANYLCLRARGGRGRADAAVAHSRYAPGTTRGVGRLVLRTHK